MPMPSWNLNSSDRVTRVMATHVLMAADTTAAWFGLVGVVIGGLITGVVTYWLERVREAREYAAAVKLVRAELREMSTITTTALEQRKWAPGLATKSWAQSWSTNRRVIAARMDEAPFADLATAYGFAEQIQSGFAAGERDFLAPKNSKPSDDEVFFRNVNAALETAMAHDVLALRSDRANLG